MLRKVSEWLDPDRSTLLFTNTRSQAERWYEGLRFLRPEWDHLLALHHGSIDREAREGVERGLKEGSVRIVVCTSSLDLGVDFGPVERVVQVGSPKGIARTLQRAGRSAHRPGATAQLLFVPTHALELVEMAATNAQDTLALLNSFGAAFVQIDEPKFRLSIRQNYLPNVTSFYYMRLHGRNVAKWWHHDKSEDRYDYLYSEKELQEFSDIAGAANALVKKSYLYTNNHFAAKSVTNAVMLKAQLGQPLEGEYPPELVDRYPEIAGLVTTSPAAFRL
jgi:superfamily II DNA/RNA helicase